MNLISALLLKELKAHWVSLAVLCVVGVGFESMYVAMFPSIKAQSAQLSQLMDSMSGTLKAMGIQDLGFTTVESFVSIEYMTIVWPILAIIMAASWAAGMLAGEINKGTMGLLLSLPFGRQRIYWTKYVAATAAVTVFSTVTILAAIVVANTLNINFVAANFVKTCLMGWLFAETLISLGFSISAAVSESGHVSAVVAGTAILMYVATAVAGLKDNFAWLKNISYFSYFDAQTVLVKGSVEWHHIIVFAASILIFAILGAILFQHRDVPV